MGGIEGKIFLPLGIAYITSIVASLFVSLTLTPALCSYLLPKMKRMSDEHDGWLIRKIKGAQKRVLNFAFPHSRLVLTFVALITLGVMAMVPFLARVFAAI